MFTHTIDQLILDPKFVKTRLSQSYKLKEFAKTSNFLILKITLVTPHWGRVTHICISKLTLVQIMACRLAGAKPLSEPMLEYCYSNLRNTLQWNCKRIQENAFENVVCEMASILSRPQCVKLLDKMCKNEMDPASNVKDTERTPYCPQTDRQMDRWTRWNQYTPLQIRWAVGIISTKRWTKTDENINLLQNFHQNSIITNSLKNRRAMECLVSIFEKIMLFRGLQCTLNSDSDLMTCSIL